MIRSRGLPIVLGLVVSCYAGRCAAADWPMWRASANRNAVSPNPLPATLHLQWVREYPKLEPAWPGQPRLWFDKAYSPVVAGQTMFVGSPRSDSMTALDTRTGKERWRVYADGPIRFAPVAWRGKLFFVCDDGCLYCLDAESGRRLWKFRAGPSDRRLLGNGRLISAWPARGAPTLVDGTLYFAASIWPCMGIFVTALDAETGRVVWENDGLGPMYSVRPHHSPAFSGLAPQGYIAAVGDALLVPNGRNAVACLDRRTGKLRYHRATGGGSYYVAAAGRFFFTRGQMFDLATGERQPFRSDQPTVLTRQTIYTAGLYFVRAFDAAGAKLGKVNNRYGRPVNTVEIGRSWTAVLSCPVTALVMAGPRLYAGGPAALTAIDLPASQGEPKVSWQARIEGTPVELLAADSRLFAVTLEGRIYCFGAKKTEVRTHRYAVEGRKSAGPWADRAAALLKATGARNGYCVALGLGSGELARELVRQSKLHVIAVDPDAKKVDAFRRKLDAEGLYGPRGAAHVGDPARFPFPPYLAGLIVCEDAPAAHTAALVRQAYRTLRPYGGTAWIGASGVGKAVEAANLPGANVRSAEGFELLVREGAPPGAADWTHQHADVANTVVSEDDLVRAPLGLLWFGGPTNARVLPRHGHGPSPQVVEGRLFIEGTHMLRALDVYTGRLLWQRELPGVGVVFDSEHHQPGANTRGSNYVSVRDGIYIMYGEECLRLDPATGKTLSRFCLPKPRGGDAAPRWGAIGVYEDLLVAGAGPISLGRLFEKTGQWQDGTGRTLDDSSSERIVVMNRHSGKVLWQVRATYGFIHNSIIAGAGKVFCIDRPRVPGGVLQGTERREPKIVPGSRLLALDARRGTIIWATKKDVFGTWLGYSKKHDILLQAGRASRDTPWDEPDRGLIAYRGKDGKVLWNEPKDYNGPCMLHGETIITQRKAYHLRTGKRKEWKHPLTGEDVPWTYNRQYGCGTTLGSRHLLTFRSAAAGYLDLDRPVGTGNLGGFRSGCTANLIPAGGVLNAPDYTRGCTCAYPNQTSAAFVHMPELDDWTFTALGWTGEPVRRIGINLGAPGDRQADDGTLWLEYPAMGGPRPKVPAVFDDQGNTVKESEEIVAFQPGKPDTFRKHSFRVVGAGPAWVVASGCRGLSELHLLLAEDARTDRTYTVRLYFAEPDDAKPGERIFDVRLQGRPALVRFDIAKEAGAPDRGVVKEFRGIKVREKLSIHLAPSGLRAKRGTVLCGVEALAEGW